jgi:hypothetical protein
LPHGTNMGDIMADWLSSTVFRIIIKALCARGMMN